jgi:hypothetical protein
MQMSSELETMVTDAIRAAITSKGPLAADQTIDERFLARVAIAEVQRWQPIVGMEWPSEPVMIGFWYVGLQMSGETMGKMLNEALKRPQRAGKIASDNARNLAIEECAKAVPSNWCDSLLTGPKASKILMDCRGVENLLHGVQDRIRALKTV